jgi:hypothetical protein
VARQITVRNLETIWKGSRHLLAMPSGVMSGRFSISAFVSNYLPSNPAAKLERGNLVKGETEISRQYRLSFFAFFYGIRRRLASSLGWPGRTSPWPTGL